MAVPAAEVPTGRLPSAPFLRSANSAGANAAVVQRTHGHKSERVTFDTCAVPLPKAPGSAVNATMRTPSSV